MTTKILIEIFKGNMPSVLQRLSVNCFYLLKKRERLTAPYSTDRKGEKHPVVPRVVRKIACFHSFAVLLEEIAWKKDCTPFAQDIPNLYREERYVVSEKEKGAF